MFLQQFALVTSAFSFMCPFRILSAKPPVSQCEGPAWCCGHVLQVADFGYRSSLCKSAITWPSSDAAGIFLSATFLIVRGGLSFVFSVKTLYNLGTHPLGEFCRRDFWRDVLHKVVHFVVLHLQNQNVCNLKTESSYSSWVPEKTSLNPFYVVMFIRLFVSFEIFAVWGPRSAERLWPSLRYPWFVSGLLPRTPPSFECAVTFQEIVLPWPLKKKNAYWRRVECPATMDMQHCTVFLESNTHKSSTCQSLV